MLVGTINMSLRFITKVYIGCLANMFRSVISGGVLGFIKPITIIAEF